MSYEKAMRHGRNIRKCRKQARQYMGFDTGSGRWPSAWAHPVLGLKLRIREWMKHRHKSENPQHTRECIREALRELRLAIATEQGVAP